MDISLELEKQYDDLQRRIYRIGHKHYLNKEDIEDLLQDVCLNILKNQVTPEEWGGVITKEIGKFRESRHRVRNRIVRLPDELT
jgi:hypothetical protein